MEAQSAIEAEWSVLERTIEAHWSTLEHYRSSVEAQ